jgi:hypothetical protein
MTRPAHWIIYSFASPPADPWSDWTSLVNPASDAASDPAVALNSNGDLELFVRGKDNNVWRIKQDTNQPGGWERNWSQIL